MRILIDCRYTKYSYFALHISVGSTKDLPYILNTKAFAAMKKAGVPCPAFRGDPLIKDVQKNIFLGHKIRANLNCIRAFVGAQI